MSIKSDLWIRRMVAEMGMIEPFSAEQVRSVENHKIISYGTSSYGYDVRCAPEFKIFTNINSTIVDPKQFDAKSFVDLTAEVCIIPPNSFALARTVEYFRIPRSVLTVCLGKCVTGDTRVVDAQTGAYVPITEMAFGRSTLALDQGRLKAARVSAFIPQGRREVFALRTRTGLRIRATANHPFRMPGGWVPLSELRPGDRIAAAGDIPVFGTTPIPEWEASLLGLMIAIGTDTPEGVPLFASSDPAVVRLLTSCVAASGLGDIALAGRGAYRLVAARDLASPPQWLENSGRNVAAAVEFVPQSIFTAPAGSVKLFLQALFTGGGGIGEAAVGVCVEYCSKSRRLAEDVHHLLLRFGVASVISEHTTATGTQACKVQISGAAQLRRYAQRLGFTPGSIPQTRLEAAVPMLGAELRHHGGHGAMVAAALSSAGVVARWAATPHRGTSSHPHAVAISGGAQGRTVAEDRDAGPSAGPLWDVVEQVEACGTEEVFDISVPRLHNFLANGLIVHNSTYARCGIIVNVTPLEPEWEGHVTLEFSNTTPLPAKIYANEGVAQMLFFESDEVCATSYRDRGGKYMGQKGVTLPKA